MNPANKSLLLAITLTAIGGCSTTQYGASDAYSSNQGTGTEPRKVILGMGAANISAVLGSPSKIADHENQETIWTYDGISSDVSYAHSGNAIVGVIFDRYFDASITQKQGLELAPKMTVVIRFNRYNRVRDFSYYTSR